MLTVVIECRDDEPELAQTLSVLVAGAVEGLVSDVIVLDHGAHDAASQIADAAGCRYFRTWVLGEVLRDARGEWLLFVEPGARPQAGWVEEVGEYVTLNGVPARFSESPSYRRPFFRRIATSPPPLELGFLISKRQALSLVLEKSDIGLGDIARGQKARRLVSEMIPSRVARGRRLPQKAAATP